MRRLLPWLLPLLALAATGLLLAPREGRADDRARKSLMDADTRAAIDRGLRFLARVQNADGSWTSDAGNKVNEDYAVPEGQQNVHHVGVTALGILAFLAAGHVPGRGPYGTAVDRAVAFVLSRVESDGFITRDGTRMYSHAFATLALAEVYGMSKAPELRKGLQEAVELTAKCQNSTGGWRYVPGAVDSDMSVTVCQMTALRAARNVGIRVKQSTIDAALRYVIDSAITPDMNASREDVGAFWYQPRSTHSNRASFSLTAAGVCCLFQAGIYKDETLKDYMAKRGIGRDPSPSIAQAVSYLERNYSDVASRYSRHYFYYYGNYYAAQAMYNVGGEDLERWERWYDRVRRDLLSFEVRVPGPAGGPEESRWESNIGSTSTFSTAVATLILSIPFDYLPIHQK